MNIILALVVCIIFIYVISRSYKKSNVHSAVYNAYLAAITYGTLPDREKDNVAKVAVEILKRISLYAHLSDEDAMSLMLSNRISEIMRFSLYAVALRTLGILPAVKNLKWHYVANPIKPLVFKDDHIDEIVRNYFKSKHQQIIELSWEKKYS
jgi:hypothetical protein